MQFLTEGNIVFGIFSLVTVLLLFYYLYFFSRLAFYKQKQTASLPKLPVSVIVCARDEALNLTANLPSLVAQQYDGPLQTLIVNDNSIDDTKYILEAFQRSSPELSILALTNEAKHIPGKKYPLSLGIREARHDTLLLTDADCRPASENWVKKMEEGYGEGVEIVLGYGAYEKLPGFLNKVIRFETFHSALQYFSYALAGQTYMGVGRNLSYKRRLFLENKGFSSINHLPGGDDDLFINKVAKDCKTAIVIDEEAHTVSAPKTSWKAWKRQKTRHFSTSKYYRPWHKFLLGIYSLSHFLFYPLAVASFFLFDWRYTLGVFAAKCLIQFYVFSRTMKKLNETDLVGWIFVMDIWMFFYYFFFAPTLWKKEKNTW